jgi:integrase
MAMRYKKNRGRWEVYWRNPYTKKIQSATFLEQGDAVKHDAWIRFKLQHEKEYFLPSEPSRVKLDDSLETLYFLYLKEKQFPVRALACHMAEMKLPLTILGRKRIGAITKTDLADILAKHMSSGIKVVTARDRMKVLFTVIRWAKKRGYLDKLPDFPELPEAYYKPIEIPTQEEVQALLMAAPPHIQRVIIIASNMGIRVGPSELFKLRWDDVDFSRSVVRVRAAAKNPKEPVREIPIRGELQTLFRLWHEEDAMQGIAWIIHFRGKPVVRICYAWEKTKQRAGVRKGITPYSLRHLFATEAIASGVDIGTVAKLMGHSSYTMIMQHYQHVLTKQKIAAVEALPSMIDGNSQYGRICMDKKSALPLQ